MSGPRSMPAASTPAPVLFVATEVFANGGIQRFNRTLLDSCVRIGVPCTVLSLNDSEASIARGERRPKVAVKGYGGNRRRFALDLVRTVWRGGHPWILVGHINFLVLCAMARVCRPFGRPSLMLVAHGIEVWSGIGAARRAALGSVRRLLCVSRYTRQRILDQAPALDPGRLDVFPNALAETWEHPPAEAAAPAAPLTQKRFIMSVTRLERGDRYKGIACVIEAFSMLEDPDVEYLIIGHGNDLPFLDLVARRLGVGDRVRFLRGLGDAELKSLYETCDAFVLPSGKEGFGIVFLEAMYFGAPVIGAAEKGALDVIHHEETGLTVPFGDVVALKQAIERVRTDASLREKVRVQGRASVVAGGPFTFARFTERCAAAFDLSPPQPTL